VLFNRQTDRPIVDQNIDTNAKLFIGVSGRDNPMPEDAAQAAEVWVAGSNVT